MKFILKKKFENKIVKNGEYLFLFSEGYFFKLIIFYQNEENEKKKKIILNLEYEKNSFEYFFYF